MFLTSRSAHKINIGADRDEILIILFVWSLAYNYSGSPTHIHSDTQLLLTYLSHGISMQTTDMVSCIVTTILLPQYKCKPNIKLFI